VETPEDGSGAGAQRPGAVRTGGALPLWQSGGWRERRPVQTTTTRGVSRTGQIRRTVGAGNRDGSWPATSALPPKPAARIAPKRARLGTCRPVPLAPLQPRSPWPSRVVPPAIRASPANRAWPVLKERAVRMALGCTCRVRVSVPPCVMGSSPKAEPATLAPWSAAE
jgi:hypothetical protein